MTDSRSILASSVLDDMRVTHGFSTRQGGVSEGAFSSLNISLKVGDDEAAVEQNRVVWERTTGLAWPSVVQLNQVHGADVLSVDRDPADLPPVEQRPFDAVITNRRDVTLAISTADCVPILLYCKSPGAVGAVHAGWRGTIAGIVEIAVDTMESTLACSAEDMVAVIGPCIHFDAFAVGPEVFHLFENAYGQDVVGVKEGELHVDLVESNRRSLLRAGLGEQSIQVLDHCTFSEKDLFFSHRRDKGKTGRHIAHISLV